MKFHERFDIRVNLEEAQQRFVNRAYNQIFDGFLWTKYRFKYGLFIRGVATELGKRFVDDAGFDIYIGNDFRKCLQALERIYRDFPFITDDPPGLLDLMIKNLLEQSDFNLGIKWQEGIFIKSGAELLDDNLVNESLKWLHDQSYDNVYIPFEKALSHFLESDKRAELLSDVITNLYESLEALAKIITGRDKDLSANRELFIKKVNASNAYKRILKEYIAYANKFRHAVDEGMQKPKLSTEEVESFIYLTGIFIRLTVCSVETKTPPNPAC
jgi:hypothetical protein